MDLFSAYTMVLLAMIGGYEGFLSRAMDELRVSRRGRCKKCLGTAGKAVTSSSHSRGEEREFWGTKAGVECEL